jgi:glutaryl-CoA dehydrogenase (non-decarboxylating)
MILQLTEHQKEKRALFKRFSDEQIAPHASRADREEKLPAELINKIAGAGFLGSLLGKEWGGMGLDFITYGLLNEEVGRACSSARSLLTVHDMVAMAIWRWGTPSQRDKWLPLLSRGKAIAAFAASEPEAGSDLGSITTEAVSTSGGYLLNGTKKWITFGQVADLFLVLAALEGKPVALLVERERQGLSTVQISGMLGVRASMLAEVRFDNCEVPKENQIGRPGFGLTSVISTALGLGRYSVAWGCVGIAQACVESSISYTGSRKQFGKLLKEHQLIRQMISDMVVNTKAARLLCCRAGFLKNEGDPDEVMETLIAKYFASRAAMKSASDAVQIHGANGCGDQHPVQRYMRDAKIMEIIEGSNQIQQILIADYGYQEEARNMAASK